MAAAVALAVMRDEDNRSHRSLAVGAVRLHSSAEAKNAINDYETVVRAL